MAASIEGEMQVESSNIEFEVGLDVTLYWLDTSVAVKGAQVYAR